MIEVNEPIRAERNPKYQKNNFPSLKRVEMTGAYFKQVVYSHGISSLNKTDMK